MDLGLTSLLMIARHHGIAADEAQLRHEFGPKPFTVETILLGAKRLGMAAKLVTQDPDRLNRAPLPAIAIDKEGKYFIAVKFVYESGDSAKPRMISWSSGPASSFSLLRK
jgi:subfamily B ATP-binding cassette protein HlyB/CyaB